MGVKSTVFLIICAGVLGFRFNTIANGFLLSVPHIETSAGNLYCRFIPNSSQTPPQPTK